MKELIVKLREEMEHHHNEVEKRRRAIESLQEVCPHDGCALYGRCEVCGYKRLFRGQDRENP